MTAYQLTPEELFSDFCEAKRSQSARTKLSEATLANYETAVNWFAAWWEQIWTPEHGHAEQVSDIDRRALRTYARWLGSDDPEPVKRPDLTPEDAETVKFFAPNIDRPGLKNNLTCIQKLIEFGENEGLIPDDTAESMEIPKVSYKEEKRDSKLDPDRAERILAYLERYHAYSRDHAMFTLMVRYGFRRGTIRSLDLEHIHSHAERPYIETVHRPEVSLPLKNDEDGERHVLLDDYTIRVLEGWIEGHRPDATDEHGLNALFATNRSGRVSKSVVYRTATRLTCPDFIGEECDCEACPLPDGEQVKYKCENSRCPHECRAGFITGARNSKVSEDAVSHRVNATPETLRKHYDMPDKSEEMARFADEWHSTGP